MPANFGLLTQGAQVPMSGAPLEMSTPVENATKRLNMEGKELQVGEQRRELGEAEQDRQILKQTLGEQGVDMATPEGVQNLLSKTKGKISPDMYAKLADHSEKITANSLKTQALLLEMPGKVLENYNTQLEQVAPELDLLDKKYDKTRAEHGQELAEAEMKQGMSEIISKYGQMKMPNGAPLFAPQLLKDLQNAPPDILHATVANTKYLKTQVEENLKRAQARRADADAQAIERGTKGAKTLVDKDGNVYLSGPGGTFRKNPQTGELEPINSLPPGLANVGSTEAIKQSLAKDMPQLNDHENDVMADYQATYGKQIPGIPIGSGAAATKGRTEYIKHFVKLLDDRGYTGGEAGLKAMERDASKQALTTLEKQNATISAGEQDIMRVGKRIEDEIKKLGGPDSPKLRAIWNKGATEWAGDPEFVGLNAAWANYQEAAARVWSGQYGAGGTAVSYLDLTKRAVGDNPNLAQMSELNKMMTNLAKDRELSIKGAKEALTSSSRLVDKTGGKTEGSGETKVSPDVQKERDKERVKPLRDEYNNTLEKLKTETDPANRARKLEDARAIRRELKSLNVDVPDPGEPVKDKPSQFKEGEKSKSKSGRDMIYHNGKWGYVE